MANFIPDRAKFRDLARQGRLCFVYREWLAKTKPAKGPLRRPLWMDRVIRPAEEAFRIPDR